MVGFSTFAASKRQSTLNVFIVKKKPEKQANKDGYTSNNTVARESNKTYYRVTKEISGTSGPELDKKVSPANSHLTPLSNIPSIFSNLVNCIPKIVNVSIRLVNSNV